MADFNIAFDYTIGNEGDLSTNPHDLGGTTRFGISQRFLTYAYPKLKLKAEELTLDAARIIYYNAFWKKYRCAEIDNQTLANKVFELVVNMGYEDAIEIVQKALNIKIDNVMGTETLKLLNAQDPAKLLLELKARQCDFYAHLILGKPDQIHNSLGWFRRAVKP